MEKIERTEVAYLFTDDEEMTKLLEEHGKKSNDELETAWLIELSNHKLRQMMLEATHEMDENELSAGDLKNILYLEMLLKVGTSMIPKEGPYST